MSNEGERSAFEIRIRNIDQQIAVLQELKAQCLQKLQILSVPSVPTLSQPITIPLDDRMAIFISYFHGREDVYAKLWVNNRSGKCGYSPACKHEWVRSFCRKPAVKCSECPNQQFLSFDEATIRQHLEGRQVIGIYPMLKNEGCYFIAIDFDKEHWMDDVRAVMATCRDEGVPAVSD